MESFYHHLYKTGHAATEDNKSITSAGTLKYALGNNYTRNLPVVNTQHIAGYCSRGQVQLDHLSRTECINSPYVDCYDDQQQVQATDSGLTDLTGCTGSECDYNYNTTPSIDLCRSTSADEIYNSNSDPGIDVSDNSITAPSDDPVTALSENESETDVWSLKLGEDKDIPQEDLCHHSLADEDSTQFKPKSRSATSTCSTSLDSASSLGSFDIMEDCDYFAGVKGHGLACNLDRGPVMKSLDLEYGMPCYDNGTSYIQV